MLHRRRATGGDRRDPGSNGLNWRMVPKNQVEMLQRYSRYSPEKIRATIAPEKSMLGRWNYFWDGPFSRRYVNFWGYPSGINMTDKFCFLVANIFVQEDGQKGDFLDYPKNKWILHHYQEFLHIFLNSFPDPWKRKFPITIQLLDAKDWKGMAKHDCQNKFTETWHGESKSPNKMGSRTMKKPGIFSHRSIPSTPYDGEGFDTSTRKQLKLSFLPFSDHRIEESPSSLSGFFRSSQKGPL